MDEILLALIAFSKIHLKYFIVSQHLLDVKRKFEMYKKHMM